MTGKRHKANRHKQGKKRAAHKAAAARNTPATGKRDTRVHRDEQGRAHLVIHRDAQGGWQGFTLSRPLFNADWQNDVAVAAATTAYGFLSEGNTPERAVALGRNAMAGTSKIVDGALALSPEHPPACRSGCSHCCHQAVGVTAPEVLAIYDHLRTTLGPAELESVAQRIRRADDKTRGMTSAERLSPELPCPFLEEARCSIYEVRPLACRGTNSLDATACDRTLRDPDARAQFLAGTTSVPCYLEPIRAFHAVTAGMQLALDQVHGLQALPLELTAAMRIMVDAPETVPLQWLAGEDPFNAARGADNSNDPRINQLAGRKPLSTP